MRSAPAARPRVAKRPEAVDPDSDLVEGPDLPRSRGIPFSELVHELAGPQPRVQPA